MTNPDNALGTNGAFGGRTSVNAFNDVLATFDSAGIVSGFEVEPDTGMTVNVGGSGTVRDVAVAEDPFGNRTTVDNISGDPIPVTIDTASTTTARIDSIVAYVNSPANASDTSVDNPTACGIISVNGTSGGAPIDSAIRTAITADGGTGSTAYYVVIANVSVPANTTTITSGLILAGKSINLTDVATTGSNGLMSGADKTKLDNLGYTYVVPVDARQGNTAAGSYAWNKYGEVTISLTKGKYLVTWQANLVNTPSATDQTQCRTKVNSGATELSVSGGMAPATANKVYRPTVASYTTIQVVADGSVTMNLDIQTETAGTYGMYGTSVIFQRIQ